MNSINHQHLTILQSVSAQARSISQIAEDIGLSNGRTSTLVTELKQNGFLEKDRQGNSVYAYFSDHLFAEYLRRIILKDNIDVSALFSRPCFDILITISDRDVSLERIAVELKVKRSKVSKCLLEMEEKGFLRKHSDKVRLSSSLSDLAWFAKTYYSYCNTRRLREISERGIIMWEAPREFIFAVPVGEDVANIAVTGISALANQGIDIVSDKVYYHYFDSERELREEDIPLDIILASNSRPRGILYALLYLRKIDGFDRRSLLSRGKELGLEKTVRDLLRFLEGKKPKSKGFPSEEEFLAICAQYGVGQSRESSLRRQT
ncbi:MAG: winged helix-turn-helix domain-containing protein [Thermoplasmata archaeon]